MTPKYFSSRIYFFTADEGGRKTEPANGYRPNFSFGNIETDLFTKSSKNIVEDDWLGRRLNIDGTIYFDSDFMPLGQHLKGYLSFSAKNPKLNDYLKAGSKFYITELVHVVGWGILESEVGKIPDENISRYNAISVNPVAKKIVEDKYRELFDSDQASE